MDSIGIGALVRRAGVRIDAVRYYERGGLLAPNTRLASGYRRYSGVEVAYLGFIRRAQVLGTVPAPFRISCGSASSGTITPLEPFGR